MTGLAFDTAFEAFAATADAYPDNAFLCIPAKADRDYRPMGVEYTYAQARERILALKALYARSGLGHGHRVALLLGNRPEHFFHLFALNALGASIVPLNPDNTADEMLYAVSHSEADFAVSAGSRLDDLRAVAGRLARRLPVYCEDDVPPILAAPGRPPLLGEPGLASEAALLYTSGTTGRPKGCIISNAYFLTSGSWYLSRGGRLDFTFGRERLFNPFPVFHMNAGVLSLMAVTLSASCLISADRFHPRSWWRDLVETGATAVHYMGVIPPILFKQPPAIEETQHKVKFGLGASVDPTLHAAFEARFGFPMVEVWGMTETGRVLCDNMEPRQITTRAIGRPRDGLEVLIADDGDAPVIDGEPGQLLVRFSGSNPRQGFFSGYLKEDEATEQAWRGGWFHTGDVVRMAPDGTLHFVDRRKNIVRRSGENISAAEVEEAIITHPSVHTVAVMPIADELREEEVLACVVLVDGVLANRALADGIFAHCRTQLAYYKAPGWIVFRETLPVTTTTKIQKGLIFGPGEDPRRVVGAYDLRHDKRRRDFGPAAEQDIRMIDPRFFSNAGPFALGEIVDRIGGRLIGDRPRDMIVTDLAVLEEATESELCMFGDGRYRPAFENTRAGVVLVNADLLRDPAPRAPALVAVVNTRLAFAQAALMFYPSTPHAIGFDQSTEISLGLGCRAHPSAIIGKGAEIGARTSIGANSIIGPGVVIGEDCIIGPNVTVSHAIIGDRVHLYPGAVIGVHGFGFVPSPGGLLRVPQLGRVLLADDVEVGVNSVIDRGAIGDTVISRGAVIDNQVQVGHNCRIGQFTVVAGRAGIAGSVEIGDGVLVGGAVGIGDHIKVGSGAKLAGGSGVTRDVPPGATVAGYPAIPVRDWHRQAAGLSRMFSRDK